MPGAETKQRQRIGAKYGLQFRMIDLMSKLRRDNTPRVAIEISHA